MNIERNNVINNFLLRLGGTVIDIELSNEQLNRCVDLAINKFRQLSDGAVEESFIIFYLKENQKEYYLPEEVISVQQVFRRGFGRMFGSAGNIDPFAYASYSNIYLAGGTFTFGGSNGLTTYELYNDYLKTAGRMMGAYLNYSYNANTKKITFMENPRSDEEYLILWCYNDKPENELFKDRFTSYWIESWALSEAKYMLANIRGRFGSLSGPSGSIQQDSTEQRNEAKEIQEKLLQEIKNQQTGTIYPPSIISG